VARRSPIQEDGKEFCGFDVMSKPAIVVENLSKSYLVGHQSGKRERYTALRDVVGREARRFARNAVDVFRGRQMIHGDDIEEFWALKDLNFEVQQGEVLGIVGHNGAGKSTLLKILSRITEPTKGRAILSGRVASLLEVGTGFHPELTGRENVFLNGAILGMTRREINNKFDEIVSFAEVEKFLDTPVKRYSSGMYVRLAFAVAAHLETEILIVDEVLAVGDAAFQRKCLEKIGEIAKQGRTILFVSHNMSSVRNLSTSCIYLAQGKVLADGSVEDCLAHYLSTYGPKGNETGSVERCRRTGDGRLQFTDFWIENDQGERVGAVASGESCTLVLSYRNNGCPPNETVDVGFGLHGSSGDRLLLLYASHFGQTFTRLEPRGEFRCRLPALPLANGRYSIWPRIEINGVEADYPQDGVGWIDVEELDFYGTGRGMGQHGHGYAPYLLMGDWTTRSRTHLESTRP
jgi:lipopolysaccharide transport system ATP-binding protein